MIKINEIYPYEELERVTLEDGNRFYIDKDGNKMSSVTTILSATDHNDALVNWREWVGDKKADQVVKEACDLGTLMHTHLECYIQDIERPKGNNFLRKLSREMSDKIIDNGLSKIDEVWGMEKMLYIPSAYAGTADLIAIHEGIPSICDYKSAKKMKSKDKIQNYFHQLAAYALAHNFLYGTSINKGVIFMVDRELKFKEFILEGNEFHTACDEWMMRLESFLKIKSKLKE